MALNFAQTIHKQSEELPIPAQPEPASQEQSSGDQSAADAGPEQLAPGTRHLALEVAVGGDQRLLGLSHRVFQGFLDPFVHAPMRHSQRTGQGIIGQ